MDRRKTQKRGRPTIFFYTVERSAKFGASKTYRRKMPPSLRAALAVSQLRAANLPMLVSFGGAGGAGP
jgi:hypothetical protein